VADRPFIAEELLHAAAVAIRDAYEDYPAEPFTDPREWHDEARAVLTAITPLIDRAAALSAPTGKAVSCTWCPSSKEVAGTVHGDPLCPDCLSAHREET
jgi:hypothetical protein